MVAEVDAIDGVSVEHVRPIDGDHNDGGLLALALAAELAEATPEERLDRSWTRSSRSPTPTGCRRTRC